LEIHATKQVCSNIDDAYLVGPTEPMRDVLTLRWRTGGRHLLVCPADAIGSLVVGTLLLAIPPRAFAERPPLADVLRKAGEMTAQLQAQLAVTVAREDYHQGLLLDRDATPRVRRTIVSDVLWVPTGDAIVWAFFRDVVSVDGAPVADRLGRLETLFATGITPAARQHAARLLEEGAGYNLGGRRTVNTPTFCLAILHPRNQGRFRFKVVGEDEIDGMQVEKVRFSEVERPTLTRTSTGTEVPARGVLLIDPAQGALVASELELPVVGFPAEIKVRYRPQGRLMLWLPVEMREVYGNRSRSAGDERVEATAKYSSFRTAQAEVERLKVVR
jgi:hypothetical protein